MSSLRLDDASEQADELLDDHRNGSTLPADRMWDNSTFEALNRVLFNLLKGRVLCLYVYLILCGECSLCQRYDKFLRCDHNGRALARRDVTLLIAFDCWKQQREVLQDSLLIRQLLFSILHFHVRVNLYGFKLTIVGFLEDNRELKSLTVRHGLRDRRRIPWVEVTRELDCVSHVSLNSLVVIPLFELSHLLFFSVCIVCIHLCLLDQFIKNSIDFDYAYILLGLQW